MRSLVWYFYKAKETLAPYLKKLKSKIDCWRREHELRVHTGGQQCEYVVSCAHCSKIWECSYVSTDSGYALLLDKDQGTYIRLPFILLPVFPKPKLHVVPKKEK